MGCSGDLSAESYDEVAAVRAVDQPTNTSRQRDRRIIPTASHVLAHRTMFTHQNLYTKKSCKEEMQSAPK